MSPATAMKNRRVLLLVVLLATEFLQDAQSVHFNADSAREPAHGIFKGRDSKPCIEAITFDFDGTIEMNDKLAEVVNDWNEDDKSQFKQVDKPSKDELVQWEKEDASKTQGDAGVPTCQRAFKSKGEIVESTRHKQWRTKTDGKCQAPDAEAKDWDKFCGNEPRADLDFESHQTKGQGILLAKYKTLDKATLKQTYFDRPESQGWTIEKGLDTIREFFGDNMYILSASWCPTNSKSWEQYLNAVTEDLFGVEKKAQFFGEGGERILAVADPGDGFGGPKKNKLQSIGMDATKVVHVDDSDGQTKSFADEGRGVSYHLTTTGLVEADIDAIVKRVKMQTANGCPLPKDSDGAKLSAVQDGAAGVPDTQSEGAGARQGFPIDGQAGDSPTSMDAPAMTAATAEEPEESKEKARVQPQPRKQKEEKRKPPSH